MVRTIKKVINLEEEPVNWIRIKKICEKISLPINAKKVVPDDDYRKFNWEFEKQINYLDASYILEKSPPEPATFHAFDIM